MRRWLLGLFIFSLCLRVLTLGSEIFWYDETFTAALTRLPFPQMLQAVRGDVHPPLWYLITWCTSHLIGRSEFALRLPAALFGTAAVLQSYSLVKYLAGEIPARWASGLMAVMPAQLYYSQEARMYSLLTLLVLLAAGAIVEKRWLRLALCCALLAYTQNLGAVYAAILGAWGLWASRGRAVRNLALAALAYAPWSVTALNQAHSMSAGFWLPPRDMAGIFYFLSFTTIFTRLPEWLLLHGIILVMVLTILSILVLYREFKKLGILLALAFLPPLALYIASLVWRPVLLDRALLPAGAAVVLLWGIALSRLQPWSRKLLAVVAAPIAVGLFITYYFVPNDSRPRQDPVVPLIEARWQPGDALYHLNLSSVIGYDYYLPDKPGFLYPELGDLSQSLSNDTREVMGIKAREILPEQLAARGYKRLWVFVDESPVTSAQELDYARQIPEHFPLIQKWVIYSTYYARFTLELVQL